MADMAISGVMNIVKVANAIKEAVETVKQNKEECREIENCAAQCTALLKRLEEQTDIMKDKVTRDPLKDVAEILKVALKLVKKCQRKRYFSHLFTARGIEKELLRVQDNMLRKIQMTELACIVHTVTNNQNTRVAPPQPTVSTPPPSDEVCKVSPLPKEEEEVCQTGHVALCGLEKIFKVSLTIKKAVETAKQNKAGCRGIEKCMVKCIALLQQLEEHKTNEMMGGALQDLAESLKEALLFVKLYQRKSYFSHLWNELRRGDISKELRRVQHDVLQKAQAADLAIKVVQSTMSNDIQNALPAPPQQLLPPSPTEEVVPGKEVTSSFLQ